MRRMPVYLAALAVTSLVAGCAVLPRAGGLPSPPATPAAAPSTAPSTARAAPAGSSTSVENARKGDPRWRTRRPGAEHEIEGFADRVSVLPGESFRLYVSTTAARYTVRAFRVGWYGGAGARKVWESAPLPGRRQAPPETIAATRTVTAARWKPGPAVDTSGWPEGSYLLRLDADTGAGRYVPITVRSASTRGRLVVVNAVTTWQAYNDWGGRSLYRGPGGFEDRSRAVSFDRPYDTSGARLFLDMERDAIEVAERSGVPLAYVTNRELDDDPHILDGATGLISLGHDEYWSAHMRRTVEAARDRGVNLAFLGANAVYWRIRFARTPLGAGRLVVCGKDDAEDPGTRRWREDEPESSLTGPMYDCFPAEAAYVVYDPGHWIFKGTGVRRGTAFPGMAGVETDKVVSGVPRPMEILSISPLNCGGRSTVAHSAYYTVPSGAAVFSSGTMRWVCALRGARCGHGVTDRAAAFVRRATTNILRTFATGPAGRLHPAEDNLESLGLDSPWDGWTRSGSGARRRTGRLVRPLDRERVPGAGRPTGSPGPGAGPTRGPEPSDP